MKKLESINKSLFEKFENNRISNLGLCLGGTVIATTTQLGNGKDGYDTETRQGSSGIVLNGTFVLADIYQGQAGGVVGG
jgi:hypothetical protein